MREENFVAINNALQIDITGQITAETLNGQVYSGPGGQTVFAVAASYSEGGRSIIAVPSSSTVDGERHSRIVPLFQPGTMTTVPRTFVDYVVTEHGIADAQRQDRPPACRGADLGRAPRLSVRNCVRKQSGSTTSRYRP